MTSSLATRSDILSWVNRVYEQQSSSCSSGQAFSTLQEVPGKAIAKLLNAIFGSQCPLHHIRFDDETPTAQLRNRRTVIELARKVGFDGRLDAVKWSDGNDFANELCFWKWLFSQQQSHGFDEISAGYDFALVPAAPRLQAPINGVSVDRKRARDDGDRIILSAEELAREQAAPPVCSACSAEQKERLHAAKQELLRLQRIQDSAVRACAERSVDLLRTSLAQLS